MESRMGVAPIDWRHDHQDRRKVECALDGCTCEKDISEKDIWISPAEMKHLDIQGDAFHPDWIDTVNPGITGKTVAVVGPGIFNAGLSVTRVGAISNYFPCSPRCEARHAGDGKAADLEFCPQSPVGRLAALWHYA